ncbi:MAG TPA: ABC transporter permease subunit [Dehalococcoidia bacterium]|nr:ABC transporter permease subunit [Dehalococcoidia bacterium]
MSAAATIARKELRDASRSGWLVGYAALFCLLALGLSYLGQRNLGDVGFENFSRTTASLVNLCLLLTPLVALTVGAGAIAGMRERGSLDYLLAQPIERWELLAGKFAGLFGAIALATGGGFGAAGLLIAASAPGVDAALYILLFALVLVLTAVMLAAGLTASVVANSRAQALGMAVMVWFVLVLFFDLVLIGLVSSANLGPGAMLASILLNPVEIARVLAVVQLEPELEVLGPFGAYVLDSFGRTGASLLLAGALLAWLAAGCAAAALSFGRRRS